MDELISLMKACIIIFFILLFLFCILSSIIKILSIMELRSEKHAYDLIAEEEELEIQNKKKKEQRDRELHAEQLDLIRKQKEAIEKEKRRKEEEKREKERIERQNRLQTNFKK